MDARGEDPATPRAAPQSTNFSAPDPNNRLQDAPGLSMSDLTAPAQTRVDYSTSQDTTRVPAAANTRHPDQSSWASLFSRGVVPTEALSRAGFSSHRRIHHAPEADQTSNPSPSGSNPVAGESLLPISPSSYSAGVDGMGAMEGAPDHADCVYYGQSSAVTFMRQVRKMVEAKIGTSVTPSMNGSLPNELFGSTKSNTSFVLSVAEDYVLPPRKTADYLLEIYWNYVHAFYPFLHKPSFMQMYKCLWSGEESASGPRFYCILNTVFALGCQLNGLIAPESREACSVVFFNRAKILLQFDIFEEGSLELVQALLLMSQYLQSTNSPSRCWIVVGLAIRIAQGLGLHQDEIIITMPSQRDREMARRVWHGCIFMDRHVSHFPYRIHS